LGLKREDIKKITKGDVYTFKDEKIGRDWIRNLFVVEILNNNIKLDWEHVDYKWIFPEEINNFEITPGLAVDLGKIKDL